MFNISAEWSSAEFEMHVLTPPLKMKLAERKNKEVCKKWIMFLLQLVLSDCQIAVIKCNFVICFEK